MAVEISYTQARARLAQLLDDVTQNREVVVIRRQGHQDAALIAADELSSLVESAHLLRSPVNARRLLDALARALKNEGSALSPEQLRQKLGLGQDGG